MTIKNIISFALVGFSLLVLCADVENLAWFAVLRLVAVGTLWLVAAWNQAFDERN